jgi:hypothetical protein
MLKSILNKESVNEKKGSRPWDHEMTSIYLFYFKQEPFGPANRPKE